ncbi:MAG: AI-2E family transporter [Anaerotignum faecicola]
MRCIRFLRATSVGSFWMRLLWRVSLAAFTIVGLPHGILIGLVSGFSNLIPYFGAVMAFFLAVLAGLFSGAPMKAVYASVLILLLQQVDSIFIVPKAVGQKLELHPVLVLLSLAAFGRMFGFGGWRLRFPWVRFAKILCFGAIAEKNLTFVNILWKTTFFYDDFVV